VRLLARDHQTAARPVQEAPIEVPEGAPPLAFLPPNVKATGPPPFAAKPPYAGVGPCWPICYALGLPKSDDTIILKGRVRKQRA
jgi:hypothetical protein